MPYFKYLYELNTTFVLNANFDAKFYFKLDIFCVEFLLDF